MSSRARIILISIWLLAILSQPAGLALAQDEDNPITLTAEVGFDGFYRTGYWTPVRVTVANSGPDVEGYLVIDQVGNSPGDQIRYQAPLSLPGQSRKTVTLYVGIDKYASALTVELVSDDQTLAKQRFSNLTRVPGDSQLYAVVSDQTVDMSVLSQSKGPARVAYLDLDELPSASPAWNALNVLILNDVDTGKLTTAQNQALRDWLMAGGHLVITGGPNWQKTTAGLADLLPVEISGSASVFSLSALKDLTGNGVGAGPFVAAQGRVTAGRVLAAQDDLPLAAQQEWGAGTMTWLALDLALAPLRDWAGNEHLWRTLLGGTQSSTLWNNPSINGWSARDGLRSIPSLALPSTLQMVLFLLAYTVLVGPVNYWVLRRMGRRELAWFSIPALILLFSGLAYVTGFQLRGGEVIINRLSLVHGTAGAEVAQARSLIGIFSPSRASYDVGFAEGTLIRPLVDDTFGGLGGQSQATVEQQGDRTVLRDLQVDVSGLRAFRADSLLAAPAVSADLAIDTSSPPRLTGRVTNRSTITLSNAGLLVGESVFALGELTPGQSVQVNERLSLGRATRSTAPNPAGVSYGYTPFFYQIDIGKLVGGNNYWNDPNLNRRYQLLQAFLTPPEGDSGAVQSVTFFAWSNEYLWPVEVAGNESEVLDTVGYFLDVRLAPIAATQGEWLIPPALTTWQVLDSRGSAENGPYQFYLTTGTTSFQFQPWDSFRLDTVTELTLSISLQSSALQAIRISLWDWQTESWMVQENLQDGDNLIANPGRFVGPSNAVRVRLENNGMASHNFNRLEVTYKGTVQ